MEPNALGQKKFHFPPSVLEVGHACDIVIRKPGVLTTNHWSREWGNFRWRLTVQTELSLGLVQDCGPPFRNAYCITFIYNFSYRKFAITSEKQ